MQPQNSQEAFNQLSTFQGGRRKPQDILKESETRLNIPNVMQRQAGLRTAITNTENLIRNVDPSVSGRTQGSFVSDAQRNRLVQQERAPLDDTFRTQNQALDQESTNVNQLRQQALQDAQLGIAEDDTKENSLKGMYDVLYRREQDAQAFAEQQRQARSAEASAARMAALFSGGGAGGGTPPVAPAAGAQMSKEETQAADFISKIGADPKALRSDYGMTLVGANRGNVVDQYKLQIYRQRFPQLFAGNNYTSVAQWYGNQPSTPIPSAGNMLKTAGIRTGINALTTGLGSLGRFF